MESKRTVSHNDKSAMRQQMRTAKQQYAEQLPSMSATIRRTVAMSKQKVITTASMLLATLP